MLLQSSSINLAVKLQLIYSLWAVRLLFQMRLPTTWVKVQLIIKSNKQELKWRIYLFSDIIYVFLCFFIIAIDKNNVVAKIMFTFFPTNWVRIYIIWFSVPPTTSWQHHVCFYLAHMIITMGVTNLQRPDVRKVYIYV